MKIKIMRSLFPVLPVLVLAMAGSVLQARENIGLVGRNASGYQRLTNNCNDATSQVDLDINNVRARLLGAGDFWWDLNNAVYVVPKVDPTTGVVEVSSLFAGALWLGGIDAGGQLKIAAQTYRQSGNDFWPGPLDPSGATNSDVCSAYDRHWKVNREQINNHIALAAASTPVPIGNIPAPILEWPARNNPYAVGKNSVALTIDRNLAPFEDVDGNGEYDPTQGDYPRIDGDQAIFWVYNDKGNIHTETNGDAMSIEIQALAFGFNTSDEINDMTFYRYQILNFGTSNLDSTFFAVWVDADLGWYLDDYVGCDTSLGLGYCYNGTALDGPGSPNYGPNPPIIGTDFFQGPKKFFNTPSGRDSVLLGMSAFLFYNNDFSVIGNPEVASHFYGYMSGTWKDGSPFTVGGNGYGGSTPSNFMFPDDPSTPLPAWSECSEGIAPADRRYLQSAGPFRLEVGAKNEVVVGVVWVPQESQVGCQANIEAIRQADSKAQALFDSDFQLISGPDAPDLGIRELDKEILLYLTNGPASNNQGEAYEETDPIIKSLAENDPTITDTTYKFQGYIIYQLKDGQVSASDYNNPDQARIVAQVDIKDGVSRLVNFTFDQTLGADVPMLMVDGNDQGIRNTFRVTEDRFAAGDRRLVNHRTYYFSVVAYAYNNFRDYDPSNPNTQKTPYLQGRQNVRVYTAIPHIPSPASGGTVLNSEWGEGPELVRLEGMGNGGRILDLSEESELRILQTGFDPNVTYRGRSGPVDVMVADPLRIPPGDFELTFRDNSLSSEALLADSSFWSLTNLTTGETVASSQSIASLNEQLIEQWGLAITAFQEEFFLEFANTFRREPAYPGGIAINLIPSDPDNPSTYFERAPNNGLLEATVTYERASLPWLTGVPDVDGVPILDWIRAGIGSEPPADVPDIDNNQIYEGVLGGTWAPGRLVAFGDDYAAVGNIPGAQATIRMRDLHSVDVVFTPDKDKWSRSVVVETSEAGLSSYTKSRVKLEPSVGKDGQPDGTGFGKSWFPGYAIDLETGERLNIVFGEASWLGGDNGNDMLWNPSNRFTDPVFNPIFGGGHYIYVMNTRYDEGEEFLQGMLSGGSIDERNAWNKLMWVSMAHVQPGFSLTSIEEGLIPTETRVRLRVSQPYSVFLVDGSNSGYNKYRFSTQDLAASTNVREVAESACDDINIVPNPYYAFAAYETSTLDNRVKFTNLPPRCEISIYSLDGILIRRLRRDVGQDNSQGASLNSPVPNLDSSLDWDLKNEVGVPVSSGMYLIHVNAEGLCERTLKWMGIMRQIDLDTF
jgi:hypothetical protein